MVSLEPGQSVSGVYVGVTVADVLAEVDDAEDEDEDEEEEELMGRRAKWSATVTTASMAILNNIPNLELVLRVSSIHVLAAYGPSNSSTHNDEYEQYRN